jgi:PAS domain S-box-containing protein
MDGCYQDVNAAWLRMHGFTRREDAIGLHFSAVQNPKDLIQAGQVVETLMRGKSITGEFSRLRRDGAIGYHSFSANPVLDDDRVIGLEGFLIDVTERKQAEEALRASEERWRSIFENSAVGIALTDPGGFFTATNRAFQQLVGYADEELRSLSYLDITHEEDRSANSVLRRELWEGNLPQFTHEERYLRKDGKLIWVRNTMSLVPGVETLPRFGLMIVEDITERKFAEEALRKSEENFATLFRCSPASITVSDLNDDDRFLEVNEAFENFTGHRREVVIGRTYPPDWLTL